MAGLQRLAFIAVAAGTVLFAGYLTVEAMGQTPRRDPSIAVDGGGDAASVTTVDASTASETTIDASAPATDVDAGVPSSLSLDLGDAATLPTTSGPRAVRVGVILVQWQGAENAGTSTRPKPAALAKAQELATLAKTDFRRAVSQGDPGSAEDIGRIPRGTLDPRTEAVLFTMPAGEVSDAIETARGYWIVKRID